MSNKIAKCEKCGKEFETKSSSSFTMKTCYACQEAKLHEMYLAYPVEKYSGDPFFANGEFYQNIEKFYEFCEDENLNPNETEIVKAEKVQFPELDIRDFTCDCIDADSDIPDEIIEASEKFNVVVREYNKTSHGYYTSVRVRIELPEVQNRKEQNESD